MIENYSILPKLGSRFFLNSVLFFGTWMGCWRYLLCGFV